MSKPSVDSSRRSRKGSGSRRTKRNTNLNIPPQDLVKIVPLPKIEEDPLAKHAVLLSKNDKAAQVILSEDRLTCRSEKGYRICRATHGVTTGCWYYEVEIAHLGSTGHVRLGWSTKKAELQAPVGYDAFSYGYRDIGGSKIHKGVREPYGEGFSEGDCIGCLIVLPIASDSLLPLEKEQTIVRYRGSLYYIDEDDGQAKVIEGSKIIFYKNGKYQGEAYTDLVEAKYIPAISLYTLPNPSRLAEVKANFGPDFKYPITDGPQFDYKPMSEIIDLIAQQQAAAEEEEMENHGMNENGNENANGNSNGQQNLDTTTEGESTGDDLESKRVKIETVDAASNAEALNSTLQDDHGLNGKQQIDDQGLSKPNS